MQWDGVVFYVVVSFIYPTPASLVPTHFCQSAYGDTWVCDQENPPPCLHCAPPPPTHTHNSTCSGLPVRRKVTGRCSGLCWSYSTSWMASVPTMTSRCVPLHVCTHPPIHICMHTDQGQQITPHVCSVCVRACVVCVYDCGMCVTVVCVCV